MIYTGKMVKINVLRKERKKKKAPQARFSLALIPTPDT